MCVDGKQEGRAAHGYQKASCGITASQQHQHVEELCKVITVADGSK